MLAFDLSPEEYRHASEVGQRSADVFMLAGMLLVASVVTLIAKRSTIRAMRRPLPADELPPLADRRLVSAAFITSVAAVIMMLGDAIWFSSAIHERPERAGRRVALPPALKVDAPVSRATIFSDGEISLSFPLDGQPCFFYPPDMFDASLCPADAKPQSRLPAVPGSEWLALGVVRLDANATRASAMFTVLDRNVHDAREPSPGTAEAGAKGIFDTLKASSPSVVPWPGSPRSGMFSVGDLIVDHASVDVDGVAQPIQQHTFMLMAASQRGSVGRQYTLTFSSTHERAALADAFARRVGSTMRLAHPAPPAP